MCVRVGGSSETQMMFNYIAHSLMPSLLRAHIGPRGWARSRVRSDDI